MPLSVNFANRQRKRKVDTKKWRRLAQDLASAIIRNLEETPPRHLSRRKIGRLDGRGVLNLVFASNETVRKLNRDWRGKNAPTDVLSFPLEEDEPPEPLPWELGDVIVSVEKAVDQAKEYGHTLDRELAFLFVHGALHVLGFDHVTKEQEKEMFGRQREILQSLGITRKKAKR